MRSTGLLVYNLIEIVSWLMVKYVTKESLNAQKVSALFDIRTRNAKTKQFMYTKAAQMYKFFFFTLHIVRS